MMSIEHSEIGANIRNYIELNKALEIHGVGRLVKSSVHCSLNKQSHFLFPGEEKIVLQEATGSSVTDFIKYLASNLAISADAAANKFERFCYELDYEIGQFGKSKVFDLGQFSNKQGDIHFAELTNVHSGDFYALPALALQPISKTPLIRKNKVSKSTTLRSVKKDAADRNFLMKVAAVAAMFVLAIFVHHNYNSSDVPVFTSLEIDQSRLNQKPEKVRVSEELNAELIPGFITEKVEVASCALIIGSFSRKSNAIDMQAKVLAAGFQLYTEEFHEFYRVGISINCSDIKGASFREIEAAFGVDPWLRIAR